MHEVQIGCYEVIPIYIYIVAEPNWEFFISGEFVNIA